MDMTRSHPKAFRSSLSEPHRSHQWAHIPGPLILLWLVISVPLVIWDTCYVFLRPHSMPGGRLHSPMWAPYKLYGEVDHVYGWAAWEANDGFTGAQSSLNVIEIVGYVTYLLLVVGSGSGSGSGIGSGSGSGSPAKARDGRLGSWGLGGAMGLRVEGRKGALAVLLGFALAVMTLSKTILYAFNEYHSGFKSIGHNSVGTIIFLWIIPNGFWIALPTYMVHTFGHDIFQGLAMASEESIPSASKTPLNKDE